MPVGTGNIVQVYSKTFSSVFGLKQKKIHVLVNRVKNGELTYEEKRGNKIKHRKYSEDIVKLIKEHVATFYPTMEEHNPKKNI